MSRVLVILFAILISSVLMATITQEGETAKPQNRYLYTHHQSDGNKLIAGRGTFPDVRTVDVSLADVPAWVIGYAKNATIIWHIALLNGDLQIIEMGLDGAILSNVLQASFLAPGQPPAVEISESGEARVIQADQPISQFTHPLALANGALLLIASNGDIALTRGNEEAARLSLNALPDGRLVMNRAGQIALYANATAQRYVHGIMGDELEGSSLVVLETDGERLNVIAQIDLPGEDVFEGIYPIWADVNDDGSEDLITTVSNGATGARIRVYLFDGQALIGTLDGPAIGQGFRWRHQLAWGPFGPDGENELIDVLTPHIGGIVEFYRLAGDNLEVIAELPGATSHPIGSRNLDMAIAGDFNGDGQIEIALLNQQRDFVLGVQHMNTGAQQRWSLPVNAQVTTNLSATALPNGTLILATGASDKRLRVWLPDSR